MSFLRYLANPALNVRGLQPFRIVSRTVPPFRVAQAKQFQDVVTEWLYVSETLPGVIEQYGKGRLDRRRRIKFQLKHLTALYKKSKRERKASAAAAGTMLRSAY